MSAPGAFAFVDGVAQYDVLNAGKCGEPQPVSGAVLRISSNEVMPLPADAHGGLSGVVYLDRIVDEDYHGRGTCHWGLVEVRVSLRASSDEGDTTFVMRLGGDALRAGGEATRYFWKGYYPRAQVGKYVDVGEGSLERVPEARRDEFFAITVSAEEGSR